MHQPGFDLRDLRGVAYALGAKEAESFSRDAGSSERSAAGALRSEDSASRLNDLFACASCLCNMTHEFEA